MLEYQLVNVKKQLNFNKNLKDFIQENAFENVFCKVSILSRSQCVNRCHWFPDVAYHRTHHGVSNRYTPCLDGTFAQEWSSVGIVDVAEDCASHCSKTIACQGIKLPINTTGHIDCWIMMWVSRKTILTLCVYNTMLLYTVGFRYNTSRYNKGLHTALQWLI